MFEASVEKYWFGATSTALAKRAATAAPANTLDPRLADVIGSADELAQLRQQIHFSKVFDGSPDIEDKHRETVLLKMYGQQPQASPITARDYLAKMMERDDLGKVSRLPGRVTLPRNSNDDDELLEKDSRSRQLSALEQFVLRKLNAGEPLQRLIDFARANGHEGVAQQYIEIGERLLESGLIAA